MTKIDGNTPAVQLNLGKEKITNVNPFVDGEKLDAWFVVGELKQLEQLSQVKNSKIYIRYRSIDEETGIILLIFFAQIPET